MIDLAKDMLDNWEQHVIVIRSSYASAELRPQAKQSTSFGKGHAYPDPKKAAYVREVKRQIKASYSGRKYIGLLRVNVVYGFHSNPIRELFKLVGWAFYKGNVDLDNLLKPALDALHGICFNNDSQVAEIRTRKIRSEHDFIAIRVDEIGVAKNEA